MAASVSAADFREDDAAHRLHAEHLSPSILRSMRPLWFMSNNSTKKHQGDDNKDEHEEEERRPCLSQSLDRVAVHYARKNYHASLTHCSQAARILVAMHIKKNQELLTKKAARRKKMQSMDSLSTEMEWLTLCLTQHPLHAVLYVPSLSEQALQLYDSVARVLIQLDSANRHTWWTENQCRHIIDAVPFLQRICAVRPIDVDSWLLLARALQRAQELDRCIAAIQSAIAACRQHVGAWMALADAFAPCSPWHGGSVGRGKRGDHEHYSRSQEEGNRACGTEIRAPKDERLCACVCCTKTTRKLMAGATTRSRLAFLCWLRCAALFCMWELSLKEPKRVELQGLRSGSYTVHRRCVWEALGDTQSSGGVAISLPSKVCYEKFISWLTHSCCENWGEHRQFFDTHLLGGCIPSSLHGRAAFARQKGTQREDMVTVWRV